MTPYNCLVVGSNNLFSAWKVLCFFILCFINSNYLFAEPTFQFHTIDRKHGLASSVVHDIVQDADGFIWFATEDGLQKYDGFELINYRHSRLDKNSLSSNIVRNLLVDAQGRLWLGTDNGLNLYRKEFDYFSRILDVVEPGKGLLSNQIRALHQSNDGNIWIGTAGGLSVLEPDSLRIRNFPQAKVRSILEDDHQQLWVGTLGKGLFLFDRVNETFLQIRKSTEDIKQGLDGKNLLNEKDPSNKYVLDIFQDSYGRLLVATWGDGVFQINQESRSLFNYKLDLPSQKVRTIHQDEQGHIWFGTQKGILVQNILENKNRLINADDNTVISPKADDIFKIFQSVDNTLWLGTYGGGVSRHSPSSRRFESYGTHKNSKLGLTDPVVFSLSENQFGDIWVGTEQGRLSKFNPHSQQFEHFPLMLEEQPFSGAISSTYQVSKELVLIGSDAGLFNFWPSTGRFEPFNDKNGNHIRNSELVRLITSDLNNRIWIGFGYTGLQAFELNEHNELTLLEQYKLNVSSPQAFLNVSGNHFIVGTQGYGILDVVLSDKKISTKILPNTENINVLALSHDLSGRLWVATWAMGIKIFSKNGSVANLDEDVGLPNNTVYSILPDALSKKMWATTNVGMVSIELETLALTRFGFYDGLQGDEFNRPGLIGKNGYMYFGGMKGFNRFFPNIIESKLYLEEPKIIGLSVANKQIKVSQENKAVLNRSLLVAEDINLQYNQTPFSIEFTSPQFVKPADIEFRYKLNGLSDKWTTSAKNSRRATYTNISPGNYVFELQVRDINSEWNSKILRKNITIHPPWWMTNIAKFVYFLIISSVLGIIFYLNWTRRQADLKTHKMREESEERLRLSLWGGGNELWDWNIKTGEVSRSDEDTDIAIKYNTLSFGLKELAFYVHNYDVDRVKREMRSHLDGKTAYFESTYRIKDELLGWRWIQDRAKVVERDENNTPIRMSGTQKDISEIHRKDEEIERLGQAFRTTSDGVWIRDAKWRLIECNPSYEKMTGFSFAEKKGEELWFPEVAEQPANIIQRIRLSLMEKGNWQGEVWAERKETEPFPQKLTIDTILDEKGYVRYYVGVFSDITYHKRTEEEFRKLANVDSLTGLPNRACLYDRLNQTIEKTRIRKERFAIFVIDIDNFKRVNDSLGHSVGDVLISEVAQRLTNCSRDGDTIARIGGDEFVIIRDDIQSSTEIASFAELMLKELNLPVYIKGQKLNLNFSIGITISPDDGVTAEKLLRNADTAMYEAKKEVMNSYHFYSVELNQRARKRLAMENELRNAIDKGAIELVYQPKVNMKTGRVCGMEALARWTHPKFGSVSPEEFVNLAEDTGLIQQLGNQLLRKAIVCTKRWVDQGVMRGRMSVNLSAHQFLQRDLTMEVRNILEEEQLDAKYLELELTESACIQEVDQTIKQMLDLRKLGVHLALDDFGTGYSSLAQLKTLPLDTLKIDKSFIQNIHHNKRDGNIVKAIIDIAAGLELNVVIEGVESKEQCDYLWQCRASIIQGFFFSKPVSRTSMTELLGKKWEKSSYLSNIADNVTSLG